MIEKSRLEYLYHVKRLSMMEIARIENCSHNKIVYWMAKHNISRRSISEAVYIKNNPKGDPFKEQPLVSHYHHYLFGLGIGLYWGEGNKKNQTAVKLGNSDPALLKIFIRFLTELYSVCRSDLRFGLQIFTDINQDEALKFWCEELEVSPGQFYKVHVTPSTKSGSYKNKEYHGVVTVYYHNKKLRDIIVNAIPNNICRDSSVGRAHPW